jgi:hypothetical protein
MAGKFFVNCSALEFVNKIVSKATFIVNTDYYEKYLFNSSEVSSWDVETGNRPGLNDIKMVHNLFREHVQCFELCSKTHRVLPEIVTVRCNFHW